MPFVSLLLNLVENVHKNRSAITGDTFGFQAQNSYVLGGNCAGDWEGARPGFTSLSIQRQDQTLDWKERLSAMRAHEHTSLKVCYGGMLTSEDTSSQCAAMMALVADLRITPP